MERLTLDQGQILDLIPPDEGSLCQYYGRIRNGKTYAATADILELLDRGQVVYANWPIKWDGYDERESWLWRFIGLLGIKRNFLYFPKENFHFCDLTDLKHPIVDGKKLEINFYDWFRTLTSCWIFLDEGHIYYDSYMALKMSIKDRVAILDTGHYDRSIAIISQRCTAIHVVLRANVNIFYKCEKIWQFLHWVTFQRTEFQDMDSSDRPNEEREVIIDPETGKKEYGEYLYAVSIKTYSGKQKIFEAYNSKYRRAGAPESQLNAVRKYHISWKEQYKRFVRRDRSPLEK